MATTSFNTVFQHLRDQLTAYVPPLLVKTDGPGLYQLNAPQASPGREVAFVYLKIGKAYVSYHLMALYDKPDLLDRASPALRKRMQGKTCFNFITVDENLFSELKDLTERSFQFLSAQEHAA